MNDRKQELLDALAEAAKKHKEAVDRYRAYEVQLNEVSEAKVDAYRAMRDAYEAQRLHQDRLSAYLVENT